MADLFNLETSGLPPELLADLVGARNRKKIAEAMLEQSMGPIQNVGGPGARLHWSQGAAKMLEAYLGRKGIKESEDAQAAASGKLTEGRAAAIDALMKRTVGTPEVAYTDTLGSEAPQGPIQAGVKPDPRGAIMEARMSPFLRGERFVDSMEANLNRQEAREDQQKFQDEQRKAAAADRAANLAAQLEQRKYEIDARLENQALDRESRAALMRSQQEITRQIGMARAEATRLAAQTRADQQADKRNEKVEKQAEAKKTVSGILGDLAGYYDELSTKGAAIDTEKSGPANLYSAIRSTGVGQMAGRAFGTEEQTIRDKIGQTSPMLMNAIRQATQQGARGLDSNAELKFYLSAVTDPSKSIQFNRAALSLLDKAYGLGLGINGVSEADEKALKDEFKKSQTPASGGGTVLRYDMNGNPI